MKIAVFVSLFPKISETFVINQITGLIDAKHNVDILAAYDPREDKVHDDVSTYQLLSRTYYASIPSNRFLRVIKAPWLFLIHFPRNPKVVLKSLNFFKYGTLALSLNLFYRVISFLYKSYDIVHCHFAHNGVLAALLKDIGVPGTFVLHVHGGDMEVLMSRSGGIDLYRRMFKLVDCVICNTNFTKTDCIKFDCPAEKIKIVPEALRLEKFMYTPKMLREGEKVKIITVGRLVEKKGHQYAIEMLADLKKTFDHFEYIIAGDGPLRSALENLTQKLGLDKHIYFLGNLDQKEVIDLYGKSHIFLLPCITASDYDQEGQALVLQEAQACGLPVLSTRHNGIPEGMLDGQSGFLVPEKDVASLTERLYYLVNRSQEWAKMGRLGSDYVRQKYDQKHISKVIEEIYKNHLPR